ncbi:MAG: HAD family phosphatase [Prevotella sp.]|nr:HAD family phosphatase [Prevotella sp.]
MIKTVIFDLGGVIMTLSPEVAVGRFQALGLEDAATHMDAYTQKGIFGALEEGKISAETFRTELGAMCGRELSWQECQHAWLGYVREVPRRNLDTLLQLKEKGYRVVLLSNTNPYMMHWVESSDFSGDGHPLNHYLHKLYKSYELGCMKPNPLFFEKVLAAEQLNTSEALFLDDGPRNVEAAQALGIRSILTTNGEDWRDRLWSELK